MRFLLLGLMTGELLAEQKPTQLDFYKAQTAYLSSLLVGRQMIEQTQQRAQQATNTAQAKMQGVCKDLGGELKSNPNGAGIDCVIPDGVKDKEPGK